jgi:hypothetical protein
MSMSMSIDSITPILPSLTSYHTHGHTHQKGDPAKSARAKKRKKNLKPHQPSKVDGKKKTSMKKKKKRKAPLQGKSPALRRPSRPQVKGCQSDKRKTPLFYTPKRTCKKSSSNFSHPHFVAIVINHTRAHTHSQDFPFYHPNTPFPT